MRFFVLCLLASLLAIPSVADRIMLTKTSKKSHLPLIKKRLNALGVKMYVYKTDAFYTVYSQEFSHAKQIQRTLQRVKKYFPSAYIKTNPYKQNKKPHIDFFINLAYAYSSLQITPSNETSFRNSKSSYSLELGYFVSESFSISAEYLYTSIESVHMQTLLSSLQYRYILSRDLALYTGALLGFGTLDLEALKATPSTSLAGGVEFGISYDLTDHIPISLGYQGLYLGHKIKYDNSLIEVDFTPLHSIKLALGYKF